MLEDWLERLCVKESFHEATTSLRALLGLAPSARAAEQMNQRMAEHAEAFGLQLAAPPPAEEAEILVATADGKGVPMRRPLEARLRRGPRRGKGEKANQKQMAYVGAVYSIARFRRAADEVLDELARHQRAADRPAPQHKQVWAEMTRVAEGEACTGRERLFVEMAIACHQRDPTRQKTLVCLMDGEAALWNVQREWLGRAVGVLDLFHVLERLWQAAHVLHREGSPAAEQFVTQDLRLLLQGKVGQVIGRLTRLRRRACAGSLEATHPVGHHRLLPKQPPAHEVRPVSGRRISDRQRRGRRRLPTRRQRSAGTNGHALERQRRSGHAPPAGHLPQWPLERLHQLPHSN